MAVATIAFGIIQIAAGNFNLGLLPVPERLPARMLFVYATAIVLILAGMGWLFTKWRATAAVLMAVIYGILFFSVHFFKLAANVYDASEWTAAMEVLGLCCGAIFIAQIPNRQTGLMAERYSMHTTIVRVASYVFAFCLLVFAFLHFKYAAFIATLIPAWWPFRWLLGILVGTGFLATAISIIINKATELATFLLGTMFLLWVFILHLPRVLLKPADEPEWTSLFVALAFSGISFTLSFISRAQKQPAPAVTQEDLGA